jgi:hypothetical protein
MSSCQNNWNVFQIYTRWRPLPPLGDHVEISHLIISAQGYSSMSITGPSNAARVQVWKSGAFFVQDIAHDASNRDVFRTIVEPKLSRVLVGETCNVFAYGHTGSGKTHTIVGHHYDNDTQIGLVLAAARELFVRPKSSGGSDSVAAEGPEDRLGLAVRPYEVRGKTAHDLLNGGMECYAREGADGQTHIRGPTEILENGKVRVCPVVAKSCWSLT